MLIPLLMAFTQLGRWVAVLDVSARERARLPALDLLLARARFLLAQVHSARRSSRYGGRANAGQLFAWDKSQYRCPASTIFAGPVGVNQFCRFTSSAWPRCWAASVR